MSLILSPENLKSTSSVFIILDFVASLQDCLLFLFSFSSPALVVCGLFHKHLSIFFFIEMKFT